MGAKNSKLTTDLTGEAANSYKLGSNQGYALIFNQEEFSDPAMTRKGSRKDETALVNVLSEFDLKITVQRSTSKADIFATMKKMAYFDYSNCRCVILVIMTHGTDGGGLWAKDETFNKSEIIDMLIDFEELAGKPKIVIIQACRGGQHSNLVNVKPPKSNIQTDSVMMSEPLFSVPKESELLIFCSTFEGRYSYRDTNKGTIFIQSLCTILKEHGKTENIERVFTLVKQAVIKSKDKYKQMPTTESTLTTDFCLGTHLLSKKSKINKNAKDNISNINQVTIVAPESKNRPQNLERKANTSTGVSNTPNTYRSKFPVQSETKPIYSRPIQFNYNSNIFTNQTQMNRPMHQPLARTNFVSKTSQLPSTALTSSNFGKNVHKTQLKTQTNYQASYSSSSSSTSYTTKSTFNKTVTSSPNFTSIKTEKKYIQSKI